MFFSKKMYDALDEKVSIDSMGLSRVTVDFVRSLKKYNNIPYYKVMTKSIRGEFDRPVNTKEIGIIRRELMNSGLCVDSRRKNNAVFRAEILRGLNGFHGRGVYVIDCGGAYKIGYTGGIKSRLLVMAVGNPFALEVIRLWPVDSFVERRFQDYFNRKRIRGEWFRLENNDLLVMDGAIEYYEETGELPL